MATSQSDQSAPIAAQSIAEMVNSAISMAGELNQESSRQYCLASMITMQLEEHSLERGASEILEERLADNGQMNRLIDILTRIKQELAAS